MKKNTSLYLILFRSTFFISMFVFGGGYVIVPLMEKKFVDELNWIDQDEMLDLIAIGQSAPGSIAVNTSILIGYRMAGMIGALITILGTIIPPLVIMTVLSYLYLAVRDNAIINNLLLGMQAGVAAIIVNVIYTMGNRIISQKKIIPLIVLIISIIAVLVFQTNILLILLFAAVTGFLQTLYEIKKEVSKEAAK